MSPKKITPPFCNRLLGALKPEDLALLQPDFEPISLPRYKTLLRIPQLTKVSASGRSSLRP